MGQADSGQHHKAREENVQADYRDYSNNVRCEMVQTRFFIVYESYSFRNETWVPREFYNLPQTHFEPVPLLFQSSGIE